MTALTQVRCGYVVDRLSGRKRPVVTGKTAVRNPAMAELRGRPGTGSMTILAVTGCGQVIQRFAPTPLAVVATTA